MSEPARRNASHGLVRWTAWSVGGRTSSTVALTCRLMAQSGYPWRLDLAARYEVGPEGLVVTQSAVNQSSTAAPYAQGAHPYLTLGVPVDELELTLPAASRLLTDERLLPVGREQVAGTAYDFARPRLVGDTVFDDALTDLTYEDGRVRVLLRDPARDLGVELWADDRCRWLQVFSGEHTPRVRQALAVEPMTAPPDAFRSGTDLVVLEPGARFAAQWGIRAR
ncbi:MAG: aldose epimerase [Nocardioides sp.]